MNDFEELLFDYTHHTPITGRKPRPTELKFSDMVLHVPVLQWYASQCWHVTEFGTREGFSTVALIAGCPGEVHSYDQDRSPRVAWLFQRRDQLPCRWVFHQGDTGDAYLPVSETDLLLIDTEHTYAHVKKELSWHGRKARRYLIFHDTEVCGVTDQTGNNPDAKGIGLAIDEFAAQFPGEYRVAYRTPHNNGLLVLERKWR